jgi:hypothetical protein
VKNGTGRKKSKYVLVKSTKYHKILDIKNDWRHVQSMILEVCQLWIPVVTCEQLSAYWGFCSTQFFVVCCAFPIKPNCCNYEHHYWILSVLRKPHYAHCLLLLIKNCQKYPKFVICFIQNFVMHWLQCSLWEK